MKGLSHTYTCAHSPLDSPSHPGCRITMSRVPVLFPGPCWFSAVVKSLSHVQLLCDPMDYRPPGSSVHGMFPGKDTGLGCHFLLQGIFLTQGSNSCLLCFLPWQVQSLPLSHLRNPLICHTF